MTSRSPVGRIPARQSFDSLAAFGFGRSGRVRSITGGKGWTGEYGRGLRQALEQAGPLFSLFGLYLSSRVDLLPLKDCKELAQIADRFPPMPAAMVRSRMPIRFQQISESPVESRTLYQSHWARVEDGRLVEVRLLRPELHQWLEDAEPLFSACSSPAPFHAAVRDFRQQLARTADFRWMLEAFQIRYRDAKKIHSLFVPKVLEESSGDEVLVLEFCKEPVDPRRIAKPGDAARAICEAWLRETLEGRIFAADLRIGNISFLGGRVSFTSGDFATLTRDAQQILWEYLNAAAAEEPEAAAEFLVSEMDPDRNCLGEKALAQSIRQIVPFRDGSWETGSGQSLAEHLFLHWKLALDCGYHPRPHLVAFWRGLFTLAVTARKLAPSDDVLSLTLRELRTARLLSQVQEFLDLNRFGEKFDQFGGVTVGMPKRVNDFLDRASAGKLELSVEQNPASRGAEARPLLLAALLMIFAGVTVFTKNLPQSVVHSLWFERTGFIVLIFLGAAMIRLAARS